ncbi:MAG: SpoIID/LytB domain-containing protein, partial [Acidobacteriota bacterium]
MQSTSRSFAIVLLIVSALASPFSLTPSIVAQETRERRTADEKGEKTKRTWPAETGSVARKASEPEPAGLSNEPIMRIALATDTRLATISTNAQLLSGSEFDSALQPLETARVRVESRLLSPLRPSNDQRYEVELAHSVSREDADQLVEAVNKLTGESPQAVADSTGKFRVIIVKTSGEQAEAVSAKLEDAGFEVVTSFKRQVSENNQSPAANTQTSAASNQPSKSTSKLKLTSRPGAPGREVLAFANGANPVLRSSAPLIFASSESTGSPVRFNDKPYRGKIEVFANTRGALTVVNVIGLEDYVRGVVPNELSPGGFPAIEALKAQAIAA